jgi:hypothetical protein
VTTVVAGVTTVVAGATTVVGRLTTESTTIPAATPPRKPGQK